MYCLKSPWFSFYLVVVKCHDTITVRKWKRAWSLIILPDINCFQWLCYLHNTDLDISVILHIRCSTHHTVTLSPKAYNDTMLFCKVPGYAIFFYKHMPVGKLYNIQKMAQCIEHATVLSSEIQLLFGALNALNNLKNLDPLLSCFFKWFFYVKVCTCRCLQVLDLLIVNILTTFTWQNPWLEHLDFY
jgi:hypothetical protein